MLPFYARYGRDYNEPESIDEAMHWIILMEEKARDKKTGLLYHAWDESKEQRWANKETGLSPHFWGRGMGWYAMALVDILDFAPEHQRKDEVIKIIARTAEAIVKVQDEKSGVWYQVLDRPDGEGNYLEGSASSMFTYFLLKAVKKGYLDKSYLASGKKSVSRYYSKSDSRLEMTADWLLPLFVQAQVWVAIHTGMEVMSITSMRKSVIMIPKLLVHL